MKKLLVLSFVIMSITGCGSMTLSERLEAGADAGSWSMCNYPYPYVKGRHPESKCDKLWDKFNNVEKKESL